MATSKTSIKKRVSELRKTLVELGVDGLIVPRADEYQGEFPAPYADRLQWITGFTGSAGAAVILQNKAVAMTDGRYLLQIAEQVDGKLYETGDIMKEGVGGWLSENAKEGTRIGYDPWLHTAEQIKKIEEALESREVTLKALDINPLDEIWKDQPEKPEERVEIFSVDIAGMSLKDKCDSIGDFLQDKGVQSAVLTLPDSICWLLNVRGSDLNYVPLVLSYAIINDKGQVDWFVQAEKIGADVRAHLGDQVSVRPPEELDEAITELTSQTVLLDGRRSPIWFKRALENCGAKVLSEDDPCIAPKARKTPQEQDAIRQAHILDGVAVTRFMRWLDEWAPKGRISELDAVERLRELRAEHESYRGDSFPTIAGFGPNGAIIHYRANEDTNLPVEGDGLFLVDSGGQYSGGTTDITRTFAIGQPSEEMKKNFTLVLKGHIAVAKAKFQPETLGREIDELARAALKLEGLDYAHGTGHGVGCYSQVHEEATSISPRSEDTFAPGMLISNEPGYYKEGEYGIRIESLVLVVEEEGGKLGFETVTLAPIDTRLTVPEMLSEQEKSWLNDYHAHVREALTPLMDDPADQDYLSKATMSL